MAWTEEKKAEALKMYADGNPTAANSVELVKEISEALEESPNGVRQVLIQAKVYVKREAGSTPDTSKTTKATEGTKRVSKESQIDALKAAIEARGAEIDDDILSKLTGKAAAYFTAVLIAK